MKKDTTISLLKDILKEQKITNDLLKTFIIPKLNIPEMEQPQDLIKLEMKSHMTSRWLFNECKKLFNIWIYDESKLDKITSDRRGDYTVYFKNEQEVSENLNFSANQIKEKGIKTITLEERLLMEIEYFKKTGNHLDVRGLTLCLGSRLCDGNVPYVRWDADYREVFVYWRSPDDRNDSLRTRFAVNIENL